MLQLNSTHQKAEACRIYLNICWLPGDASTAADCLMLSQSCIALFDAPQAWLVLNAVARSKFVMQLNL